MEVCKLKNSSASKAHLLFKAYLLLGHIKQTHFFCSTKKNDKIKIGKRFKQKIFKKVIMTSLFADHDTVSAYGAHPSVVCYITFPINNEIGWQPFFLLLCLILCWPIHAICHLRGYLPKTATVSNLLHTSLILLLRLNVEIFFETYNLHQFNWNNCQSSSRAGFIGFAGHIFDMSELAGRRGWSVLWLFSDIVGL